MFGVRHLQAFLMFLGLTLAYAMRVNMSVAIVAMTNNTAANPDYEVCVHEESQIGQAIFISLQRMAL